MIRAAFENVRNQIGACGIWCGSCAVGNGSLRLASQHYFELLESHGIKTWAPPELDYEALATGLSTVSDMAACPGCRQDGGRSSCEMKACTVQRGLSDCSECDETDCPQSEPLEHMRSGAVKAGLFVKMPPGDPASLIEDWTKQLATQFPSLLLFLPDPDGS
ncbi:DUF3795 domain-containing protein [Candidatus Bipolaricaulota bacterium]